MAGDPPAQRGIDGALPGAVDEDGDEDDPGDPAEVGHQRLEGGVADQAVGPEVDDDRRSEAALGAQRLDERDSPRPLAAHLRLDLCAREVVLQRRSA